MFVSVSWKVRALDSATLNRMLATWSVYESNLAKHPTVKRLAWWSYADASAGFTILESADDAALSAFVMASCVALGEFLELDCRPVLDIEAARAAVMAGVAAKEG
jgi:hypothetical protein